MWETALPSSGVCSVSSTPTIKLFLGHMREGTVWQIEAFPVRPRCWLDAFAMLDAFHWSPCLALWKAAPKPRDRGLHYAKSARMTRCFAVWFHLTHWMFQIFFSTKHKELMCNNLAKKPHYNISSVYSRKCCHWAFPMTLTPVAPGG